MPEFLCSVLDKNDSIIRESVFRFNDTRIGGLNIKTLSDMEYEIKKFVKEALPEVLSNPSICIRIQRYTE